MDAEELKRRDAADACLWGSCPIGNDVETSATANIAAAAF